MYQILPNHQNIWQDGPWDCARGALIKSFSCCEEGLQRNTLVVWIMLGILITLSFLFLFVGIGKYMEIPSQAVAGWKSGVFRCSNVLLCPMSGRTAAIAEVKAIQSDLLQTR